MTLASAVALFLVAFPAFAGVRSDCSEATVNDPPLGCLFRFNEIGSLDVLTCSVIIRDCWWGFPLPDCSTTVRLVSQSGELCCCPNGAPDCFQSGFTDENGEIEFTFSRIGGHGTLVVNVSSHCYGNLWVADVPVDFTSGDLNGSCEMSGSVVDVVDLGAWAAGLPPGYQPWSDYDCSGNVNVIDLGHWAASLGRCCGER
jgi:hypothetical protein